jgi:hypothetical protein
MTFSCFAGRLKCSALLLYWQVLLIWSAWIIRFLGACCLSCLLVKEEAGDRERVDRMGVLCNCCAHQLR